MQYWRWFSRLLNGDLGNSLVIERPIGPMVVEAFSHTATLALIAIIIVALLGVARGVLGAVRHDQWQDHFSSVFALVGISVPEFFWGIVLILLFAGYLKLLPSTGYQDFSEDPLGWLRHLVLPVAILTFTLIAHVSRQMRSSMLDVLQSNYVRSARAFRWRCWTCTRCIDMSIQFLGPPQLIKRTPYGAGNECRISNWITRWDLVEPIDVALVGVKFRQRWEIAYGTEPDP